MIKADFKRLWPTIKDKPVKIKYGKQTFQRVVLVRYKEAFGLVNTAEKGELSTAAIKEIEVLEEVVEVLPQPCIMPEVMPVACEAEEVVVAPQIGKMLDSGYFLFIGRLGGNWKRCKAFNGEHKPLKKQRGKNVPEPPESRDDYFESEACFTHRDLFNYVLSVKRQYPDETPMVLVDDTGITPEYYRIKKGVGADWFFNKIGDV